jgi:hypothetical protein
VPRVYFEANWPGLSQGTVDVLVIDRDGVGDTQLVEIKRSAKQALLWVPTLLSAHAPFRWVAFFRGTEDEESKSSLAAQEILYPKDTGGRVGVIEIREEADGTLGASVKVPAERFPDAVYDIATSFSGSNKAAIQFGGGEPPAEAGQLGR